MYRWFLGIGITLVVILVLLIGGFLFSNLWFFFAVKHRLMVDFGMSESMARGVATLITLVGSGCVRMVFSLDSQKRRQGIVLAALFFAGYSFLIHLYLDGFYYSPSGEPRKWYLVTPQGDVLFFDAPGRDPKFGIELKPVESRIIVAYDWMKGVRTHRGTGRPLQFCRDRGKQIEQYESPFHPVTGEIMCLCSEEQIQQYTQQRAQQNLRQNVKTILDQALLLAQSKNYAQALELLAQAQQLSPKDRRVTGVKSQIRRARAVQHRQWLEMAHQYLDNQALPDCLRLVNQVLVDDPSNQEAQALLAETHQSKVGFQEKEARLNELSRNGLQAMADKEFELAATCFREILKLDPNRQSSREWLREALDRFNDQARMAQSQIRREGDD
ncbi:MAG: tetratricopeptide repeat protein [Acidobacteria bacterium]|nr:tetratricopeptide repeat protein [Acidobacteriota bacterium]